MLAPWICAFICVLIAIVFFHHKLFLEDSSHSIQSFAKESNFIGQLFSILLASAFVCGSIFFLLLPICFAKQDAYEIEFNTENRELRVRKIKPMISKYFKMTKSTESDQIFPISSFRGTSVSIQSNVILQDDDNEVKLEWQCHISKPDESQEEIIVLDYILCSPSSTEVRSLQSLNQKVLQFWQSHII
jgi:hypothetical protein